MTLYFFVKYLHVLGAVVILGTGTGIAFFMLMAHRSRDAAFIARTAAIVVTADMLFTLSAVILRGIATRTHWLARQASDSDIAILAELSRKCAVDAVVEGLRRGEGSKGRSNKR